MLISVIIPNYNHAKYLRERIESVLNQTFQDIEVIILDDCSQDNSREIINFYKNHPKVGQIIFNSANSGSAFCQWKKGLDIAQGKYVWIAESDDLADVTLLETLHNKITANDEVVLAYCSSYRIDSEGLILGIENWAELLDKERWRTDYNNDGKDEVINFLKYRNTIPNASAVLFKKDTAPDFSLFKNFYFTGDWLFWSFILLKGRIAYCSKSLNYFREHSSTTRSSQNLIKELKRINEYFSSIKILFKLAGQPYYFDKKKHNWIIKTITSNSLKNCILIVAKGGLPGFIKRELMLELIKRYKHKIYAKLKPLK